MSDGSFYYPQKMGRVILQGMEEVLGASVLTGVLRLNSLDGMAQDIPSSSVDRKISFNDVTRIQTAFELAYGPRGGRGVALRVGRASFKYGLKEYGSMLGLTEMAFRLLALPTKLNVGAKSFADLFNKYTDQKVRIEEQGNQILWHIERCPLCWDRKAEEPVCHLAVGLLQEALYWVSGGKVFNVEEKNCIACGSAACTIVIDKTPLS